MRGPLRTLLLALLAWSWLGASPASSQAVWIWETETLRLLEDRGYADHIADLLKANGFDTLYLYADGYEGRNPVYDEAATYRSLLARLHSQGFRVEALLGSAPLDSRSYVLPERAAVARAMLQRILDYNQASRTEERFDGVHLDIEPYTLDAWNEQTQEAIARLYLERSQEWLAMARAQDPKLQMGAAIPFWFDGLEVTWKGHRRPLNEHVQDLYDYVAIMDYRNQAEGRDGIIAHGLAELTYADRIGRRVIIGLETGATQPAKITFHGRGPDALAREMGIARKRFVQHRSFGGFALHHLGSWLKLLGIH